MLFPELGALLTSVYISALILSCPLDGTAIVIYFFKVIKHQSDFRNLLIVLKVDMLFHNDLSGALDRFEDGRSRYTVIPDGEYQRREAVKLSINMIMYALTSNYKHDQAHVKELIEDGRLDEMDF